MNTQESQVKVSSRSHTPGPWTIQTLVDHFHNYEEWTTFSVRSNPQNHCLAVIGDVDRATAPHNEANARLIAAAPDLLEACQSLWKMIEDGTLVRDVSKDSNPDWSKMLLGFTMTLNKVDAAIAKATGGQSYPL